MNSTDIEYHEEIHGKTFIAVIIAAGIFFFAHEIEARIGHIIREFVFPMAVDQ